MKIIFQSTIVQMIIAGVVVALIVKGLEIYGPAIIMKSIYQHFVVGLWPMWVGLIAALLYWIIKDYIQLRRFRNKLIKWIGLFAYKIGIAHV